MAAQFLARTCALSFRARDESLRRRGMQHEIFLDDDIYIL